MKLNTNKTFEYLFILSLLWLLLEGVFRKWLLPSLTVQLFAVKYLVFGLLYLMYFIRKPYLTKTSKLFQILIILFVFWCGLQITNRFLNPPLLVTIFGYINYLFFIPIFIIVQDYFTSIDKVERFIKILAQITIPIYILGITQYYLSEDHFLNSLANDEQKFAKVATHIRSNSIFTFVKGYNSYLLFIIPMFFSYLFFLLQKGKKTIFIALMIGFGVLNMLMTGSRLPTFLAGIFILVIIGFIFFQIQQLRKSILVIVVAGFIVSIGAYSFNPTFKTALDGFISRYEYAENVAETRVASYGAKNRLIDRLDIFKFSEEAGLMGFGIGTTYQGTGFFLSSKRFEIKFEEEGERLVLELGIIGGILAILMRFFIFMYSFLLLFRIKKVSYSLLILPLLLQLIPPLFFLNSITFSYYDNFIYWFSFGLILTLEKLYYKSLKE
ncbi:MAG: hypothetical protein ACPGSL_06415 [Vicingaceae bacterium]